MLTYGTTQLLRGQTLDVPDELGIAWVEREEAVLVPFAEQATMPRAETAVMPRPIAKPKPPVNPAKRAR